MVSVDEEFRPDLKFSPNLPKPIASETIHLLLSESKSLAEIFISESWWWGSPFSGD